MEELSHPDHKSHGTPAALEKERMQEEEVEEEEEQQQSLHRRDWLGWPRHDL